MIEKGRYFITGFPGFIGRQLAEHLLAEKPQIKLTLLVQTRFIAEYEKRFKKSKDRIELLSGDVADIHLGLSRAEYERVCGETTTIFHLAALSHYSVNLDRARRVNVEGTRNVLDLAADCTQLRRLVHFSTALVSGDRTGVIAEDELDQGQSFRNVYERTKFEAEKLVEKSKARLPITIIRPSTVVGHSATGEIDRFDGPYALAMMLVGSPVAIPLPLPGNAAAPLNVVPVDFVVRAAAELSELKEAEGKTVHLVDPNPMSARRVYDLIADKSKKKLTRFSLPVKATELLLRIPGLESRSRQHRAAIQSVNHLALYNCRTASDLLEPSGISCPPLHSYLETLMQFAQSAWKTQHERRESVDDPLDT
jgi:thioester reductase-like protein